ncbi:MAG TPA: GNAT family N-acetyltransferase, partial [Oscillospiraceae bacterium]|nr:GNAT family N-acetyltransferase [Oscillospiraceae bacterium]
FFEEKKAEAVFALLDGREVGFMLFFYNFSTFLGRAGLYLEDLFILPEYRFRGVGRSMMQRLAGLAVERGCGRLDWQCLDWNAPSIAFYRSLGARPVSGWTTYRLAGDALASLAQK